MIGTRGLGRARSRHSAYARLNWWARPLAVAASTIAMVFAFAVQPTPIAGASKQLTTVTMEEPAKGAAFLPFYLGIANGIFKKHGINLQLNTIPPPLAVDSILSGKLDFMSAIGSAGSAGVHGQPIRVYDTVADRIDFVLMAPKSISTVSQLAGKTIVGESAVSTINLVESAILQHSGVAPSSVSFADVTGGNAARAAVVLAGKAVATIATITTQYTFEKKGLHVIANAAKESYLELPFTGLATSTSFADSHKKLLKQMIEATSQATALTRNDAKMVVKTMETASELVPLGLTRSEAKDVWKTMRDEWLVNGVPPAAAIQNQLQQWKTIYQLPSAPPVANAYDLSMVKGLAKGKGKS